MKGTARPAAPPKLLHIAGSSLFGGDSVLILEMGKAAQRAGFEVDVLATHSVFQEFIRSEGLGLVDLDVIRREIRPIWDLRGLGRLTRFLQNSSYSVVHTHTSKPGVVGRLAAIRAGVPVIIHTVHGFGFHEESGMLARRVYSVIERAAARWCDRIVTVSEFHRNVALGLGIADPEKIIAIPNGVHPVRAQSRHTRGEIRSQLGVENDFVILSTGRLAEQKGLEYLIRALPMLAGGGRSLQVLLAGDGPLRSDLEALVTSLGVQEQVRFLGFRDDIGDLLSAADLVALPSLWEGMSISLLEAMAAGKAIVTTTIGSNREVTDDGQAAILVPPKDPASLAGAIEALMSDDVRRRDLGTRAEKTQSQRYGMDRMLDAYLDEYERLMNRSVVAPGRFTRPIQHLPLTRKPADKSIDGQEIREKGATWGG
jgi:glycosyltransferase involved in cell wall biosynthesis